MVPFTVDLIEELVDGRVRVTWTTVADDGMPLTEADVLTPDPGANLEEAIAAWLEGKRIDRERINANPKVGPRRPAAVKRSTATLSQAAVDRIKTRVGQPG